MKWFKEYERGDSNGKDMVVDYVDYWIIIGNNGVEYGPITITPNPYYPSAVENDTVKE